MDVTKKYKTCPSCSEQGIEKWKYYLASPEFPASCVFCRESFYKYYPISTLAGLGYFAGFYFNIPYVHALIPLVLMVVALESNFAKMHQIEDEKHQKKSQMKTALLALVLFGGLFLYKLSLP